MTLYSSQAILWAKYDEEWAYFERNHLKNSAPIPNSAKFLLIHLLKTAKDQKKRKD